MGSTTSKTMLSETCPPTGFPAATGAKPCGSPPPMAFISTSLIVGGVIGAAAEARGEPVSIVAARALVDFVSEAALLVNDGLFHVAVRVSEKWRLMVERDTVFWERRRGRGRGQ
ncbi:hypothetical protein PgNI_10150 [Pyricularia grisea]|uniref:Uncharacterized protein n=1 Tax=Pyricularia grisea TaxID=148305 RepID=A0A6P8AZS8_PYRGI|nr:hypothetical protein PgNI_10150 [Pyricularia grisea]TLD07827.1 hypothetical protein PgNI_10150 [Pyricularia grisea]